MKFLFRLLLIVLILFFACSTDKNPHAPQVSPRSMPITQENNGQVEQRQLSAIQARVESIALSRIPMNHRAAQIQVITVPDPDNDIYTIQDGLNVASPEDTVRVLPGTYTEEFFVNVPNVHLIAEPGVLLQGGCYFAQDNITMENFHIVVQRPGGSGIWIWDVSGSVVRKNTIESGFFGIALKGSAFSLVEKNVVTNSEHEGIILHTAHNNTVTKNTCVGHRYDGIEVGEGSINNEISSNACKNNGSDGIRLHTSSNNFVF